MSCLTRIKYLHEEFQCFMIKVHKQVRKNTGLLHRLLRRFKKWLRRTDIKNPFLQSLKMSKYYPRLSSDQTRNQRILLEFTKELIRNSGEDLYLMQKMFQSAGQWEQRELE